MTFESSSAVAEAPAEVPGTTTKPRTPWDEIERLKKLALERGRTTEEIDATFCGNCKDQLNQQIEALRQLAGA